MSKRRGSLQASSTGGGGSRPIHKNRALKKARQTQLGEESEEAAATFCQAQQQSSEGGDGTNSACSDGAHGGDGESREKAGDDITSSSSDELGKDAEAREEVANTDDREKDQCYLALEYAKSQANREMITGMSGSSSSDEDASENEETEQGLMAKRRGTTKEEETSDESSGSSSDGESDEEEEEESEDTEKKPNDSTAFGRAFQKIMKKKLPSTALTEAMGPMLSSHKQLVTKKLEEAAEGRKAKSDSKREKQALREKGHTVPTPYAAAKDKELMKLATRGVVKLFNAVSKAQSVQEAAKVSKDSEVKEVAKRSKSTFLAMLQGGNGAVPQSLSMQRQPLDSKKEVVAEGQPGWSALRETFMLGKSKLKDWDKKQDEPADVKGAESSADGSDSE